MGNSISPDTNRQRQPLGVGLYRHSVAIFLAALVLFMVAVPFAQQLADPGLVEGPFAAAMLITGVLAVGGRRKSLLLATLLVVPTLGARWLYHLRPEPISHSVFLVLGSLLFILVTVQLLRFILRALRVDSEVLFAGVATYLVLGMTWAMLYLLVDSLDPNAFLLAGSAAVGMQDKK